MNRVVSDIINTELNLFELPSISSNSCVIHPEESMKNWRWTREARTTQRSSHPLCPTRTGILHPFAFSNEAKQRLEVRGVRTEGALVSSLSFPGSRPSVQLKVEANPQKVQHSEPTETLTRDDDLPREMMQGLPISKPIPSIWLI